MGLKHIRDLGEEAMLKVRPLSRPNGSPVLRLVRKRSPQIHIVILATLDAAPVTGGTLDLDATEETLADIILQAFAEKKFGMVALAPSNSSLLTPGHQSGVEVLTETERRILRLMADGLIKKEIAAQARISVHTVSTHIRSIYEKLEVTTNTGAVAKALREHLI